MTPREFRQIVSQKLKFDSSYLGRVTSLFEIARYSQNEISQKEANDATECLSALSSELKELKTKSDIVSE